jgi:calcineurin-like phosphoesterase family protein
MNAEMVSRWNSVVAKNDLVYYLGDMFFNVTAEEGLAILDQLHGKIHFIKGNHDETAEKLKHRFESFQDMLEIKQDGHLIVLCHYAMRTWNKSFYGSYHVYGHTHNQMPEDPHSLSFDVGVDVPEWNFTPVRIEKVLEKMALKTPNFIPAETRPAY